MNEEDFEAASHWGQFKSPTPKPTPPDEYPPYRYAFVSDCYFPKLSREQEITKRLDQRA